MTDPVHKLLVWRRTRRQLGTATRQVAPITIDRLRHMVATCQATPAGHRDQALLVVGCDTTAWMGLSGPSGDTMAGTACKRRGGWGSSG
jgi:hypothetical protein